MSRATPYPHPYEPTGCTTLPGEARPEGRRERRTRETRRRILQAAVDLFGEEGFEAVSIEEIAERADVARGTVFNYFASKEALISELGELHLEQLRDAVRDGRIAGTAAEKIGALMRILAEFPGQDAARARKFIPRALAALTPGEMPDHKKQVFEMLRGFVEEGQRAGEIRQDLPSCTIAGFFMGLQFQATMLWAYGLSGETLEQNIRLAHRLGLEGVSPRGDAELSAGSAPAQIAEE